LLASVFEQKADEKTENGGSDEKPKWKRRKTLMTSVFEKKEDEKILAKPGKLTGGFGPGGNTSKDRRKAGKLESPRDKVDKEQPKPRRIVTNPFEKKEEPEKPTPRRFTKKIAPNTAMLELQAKINVAALDPNAATPASSTKKTFAQSIVATLDDREFLRRLPSLKGFTRKKAIKKLEFSCTSSDEDAVSRLEQIQAQIRQISLEQFDQEEKRLKAVLVNVNVELDDHAGCLESLQQWKGELEIEISKGKVKVLEASKVLENERMQVLSEKARKIS